MDEVAPAIAIAIDGEPRIGGGNELRLPEGAGPGAVEIIELQVAAADQLQGRQELAPPEVAPSVPGAGQGRQRVRQEVVAGLGAEIGLHAPDRGDDMLVDAVLLLDPVEDLPVFAHHLLAPCDPLRIDEEGHVVPDRRLEFGLQPREAQHLVVRRADLKGAARDGRGDAGRLGGARQSGDAAREVGPGLARQGEQEAERGGWQKGEGSDHYQVLYC